MRSSGTSTGNPLPPVDGAFTFGVLGPLEIRAGTSLLDVRGPQERALLALLLTEPGRVLSVPAIVAGLWGEHPPGGAEKTVQSYVSRLRRTLPGNGSAVVLTRAPGYLAAVEPAQVDAERFRVMVATGRRDLAAGRAAAAAAALHDALRLWRGEAYAEFDAPFAVAERTALEELRLAAVEDRVAADLGTGAGPELVGELEALLVRHPWRERLWAQLMTALYRSGRQGDALRAFQRARASLVDELGVEPGPELQAVEAMVLAQDTRLAGSPRSSQASARVLPVTGPVMVGRDAELGWLLDAYDRAAGGAVVRVLVTGPHGMGKTRLLTQLAHAVQAMDGLVMDRLPRRTGGAEPALNGTPVAVILDDLQQSPPADLATLSEWMLSARPPLLVAGAAVWDALGDGQRAALATLFTERLDLVPLRTEDLDEIVRLYVPPEGVADALDAVIDAGGVPLQVHAAASRYAEQRAAADVSAAAAAIPQPHRHLASSRERVADGVLELQRIRLQRTVAHVPGDVDRVVCPYKGLAFFDVIDAPYFFGRERLVARLTARLVDAPLLAVVGASGSGKSSVVRAGLVAAVGAGTLPGSERWHTVLTTPTQPSPELPSDGARTLLVVDQFEELFTTLPPLQREEYAGWLGASAAADDVTVVVTVRSDYFGHASAYPGLAELMAANTVLVGEMSPEELAQAVELPAAAAGLELEPGLAQAVAGDVVGEPGGLPLLSTALLSLWERRDGRRLSLAAYHELGGVRTAVAQLADAAYARLTPAQQSVARRILRRLADPGESGESVRRRAPLEELAADTDLDARTVLDTLAARRLLTVSKTHAEVAHEALLREWPRLRGWLDEDESGRRLRRHLGPAAADWQRAGRDTGELYRGLRLTAALDLLRDNPDDLTELERDFLRVSQEAARAEAERRRRSIRWLRGLAAGLAGVLVLALFTAWVAVDRRNEAARSAAAAAGSALQADVRALRAGALGEPRLDLALLYAAQAQRFDPSSDSRATLLQTVQRSPETTSVFNADQRLQGVALSGDGSTLAAVGSEGTAYVWDTDSRRRVATVPGLTWFGATSLDLSPDGRHLVVVGVPVAENRDDQVYVGQLVVVDLTSAPQTVRAPVGPALSAARFTANGRTVATLGVDGRVGYVDIRTGEEHRRPDVEVAGPKTAVLLESTLLNGPANRQYLVAADAESRGPVTAWEVGSGRALWSEREPGGTVAAISPDGAALVLGHVDGRIERVDLHGDGRGERRTVPSDLVDGLVDVAWSPDGGTFAGATSEGTVEVWDAETLEPGKLLRGHSGTVSQLTYSPDGTTLYASGEDRSVLGWDLTDTGVLEAVGDSLPDNTVGHGISADGSLATTYLEDRRLQLLEMPAGTLSEVEIPPKGAPAGMFNDPRGRYVGFMGTGWPDADQVTVRVVDAARRTLLPYTIRLVPKGGFDAAFTGDGRSLVTAADRRVVVRDVRTGRPVPTLETFRAQATVAFVATDARGRTAAFSVAGGTVEVADLTTGRRLATLDPIPGGGENLLFYPLLFSPDGTWFAAGSDSGRVVVWDTRSWQLRSSWVAVQGGMVDSLAFTPDSRFLVSGGAGTATVWDVEQGAAGGATIDVDPVRSGGTVSVGTRDGGQTIATLTEGRGVQLWSVSPGRLLEHACQVAGRNLTRAEWDAALPDRPYERTCPQLPPG
ncbi:hypothetical protein BH24ACT13_BH24ACT13_11530 [soil metagenome]